MEYRTFGRIGWQVGAVGYGMWGMGDWTGADDEESLRALQQAVDLGCNFFDTAYAYGEGHSERLLAEILRNNPDHTLYAATKIPPKNRRWPARVEYPLDDTFPRGYMFEMTEKSLENLGVNTIDLMQFHVWNDAWAEDERWQRAVDDLKAQGMIRAVGISINRWEPENGIAALRTGALDAVQVIYNIFDQNPEDDLFPVCERMDIGVIARVPFDEGTLTGHLTKESTWPEGDWRNSYFVPENLIPSVERAEALRPLIPAGMSMAEMALRFILANPMVSTTIPGMRKPRHVAENLAAADGEGLPPDLIDRLRAHRWVRRPTGWSQ
jgi:aryl-alcohol dehydrogenase-like predicted oxidoreductase